MYIPLIPHLYSKIAVCRGIPVLFFLCFALKLRCGYSLELIRVNQGMIGKKVFLPDISSCSLITLSCITIIMSLNPDSQINVLVN